MLLKKQQLLWGSLCGAQIPKKVTGNIQIILKKVKIILIF